VLQGLVVCLLALLAVGCGGSGERASAVGDAATPARPPAASTADPRPGRVLLRFVRAAGRGDARTMWTLLSAPTQASLGPTYASFRRGAAFEFREGFGSVAPTARVILSRTLNGRWAVAAVSGPRVVEGEREHFAYGAALVRERGGLRLELGGLVFAGHRPEPNTTVDAARPQLSVRASAGQNVADVHAWLDGRALATARGAEDPPFTATIRGVPARPLAPGLHEAVVFAAAGQTAAASAWSFVVE
jgi:hypothetical protein